jgi:hypothetical protein
LLVAEKSRMRTYQHSRLASAQSCSQSASDDERALAALPFAAYKQLWLTYKAMQPTQHFVVSLGSMRTLIFKALVGLSPSH